MFSAGFIVGMFGSAPYLTSSFIASMSLAYAARQNGVAPVSSTRSRSKLYCVYQSFRLIRAFGFAPLSRSACIRSR